MTEEEAKTKWCPIVRPVNVSATARAVSGSATCIASACMAWRWAQPGIVSGLDLSGTAEEVAARYPDIQSDGYCGLAGAPP